MGRNVHLKVSCDVFIVANPRFRACIVMLHNMSPVFNVGTTPHASNFWGRYFSVKLTRARLQNSRRFEKSGRPVRRKKTANERPKRNASAPLRVAAPLTASPPNPLRLPQARTILLVFALTFPLSATLLPGARSHRSMQAAWSRCTRLATGKDTRTTHIHPTDRANRCTNNVPQPRGRQKYMLTLG